MKLSNYQTDIVFGGIRKVIGTVLLFTICCVCVEAGERLVQNGQTVAEVIQILGEPNGNVVMGKDRHLYYDGMTIKVTGGVVTDLPSSFNEALKSVQNKKQEKELFVCEQQARGLVCYKGEWITKDEAAVRQKADEEKERALRQLATDKKRQSAEIQAIKDQFGLGKENNYGPVHRWIVNREDGSEVDHRPLATPGKVTYVLFHRKGSPICPTYVKYVRNLLDAHPYLEFKQIEYSNGDPIAYQFHIDEKSYQTIRIIDVAGNLCSAVNQSDKMVLEYIAQAKKQSGL